MPARRYTPCLLAFLLIAAGSAFLPSSAVAAIRQCDVRVLPRPDTLSVEAAARKAAEGKLQDIHVQRSCLTRNSTSVYLIRPNPTGSPNRREQWEMSCERQQSTWYKRGGWDCSTPTLTRDMDAETSFLGAKSTLLISFDGTLPFETAEVLVRRALVLFESGPRGCFARAPNQLDWKHFREQELDGLDTSMLLDVSIDTRGGELEVRPLGLSPLAFIFQPGAVADPANAPACWTELLIID